MAKVLALAVAVLGATAAAYQPYQAEIPNALGVTRNGVRVVSMGHIVMTGPTSAAEGARNPFGVDFAAAGRTWTRALCLKDSDGDGMTNGEELGDPSCAWVKGGTPNRTTMLSHPGFNDNSVGGLATAVAAAAAALIAAVTL